MKTRLMANGKETSVEASLPNGVARQQIYGKLVKELGGTYASALDINLTGMESDEVFKWFLASLLLGARIDESIAINTYKEFIKAGVVSPEAIFETGWLGLVRILDRGGYARCDFKTATKILLIAGALKEKYEGDLNRLHFFAEDERDLEKRLQSLGKWVGPVTVNIFLRELRDIWEKAEPPLAKPALLAVKNLRLIQATDVTLALRELRTVLEANGRDERRFSDLEAALVRLGKNYCGKKRCSLCPVKEECQDMK